MSKMTSLPSMTSSFDSGYRILRNFEILYFWTDLAEIWPGGQILGADPEF